VETKAPKRGLEELYSSEKVDIFKIAWVWNFGTGYLLNGVGLRGGP